MKMESLSEAPIKIHWNLSKESITLGGALTLRAECEMISQRNGQKAFNILISPGANSIQSVESIYNTVFKTSILVFNEIQSAEGEALYPDSYLTFEKHLFSFSTERIALLFDLLKVRPKLEWSEEVHSEVNKILGTLKGKFICLSLKFSGHSIEDGDAEIVVWREVVRIISINLNIPVVIIGNDPLPEDFSRDPRVRFLDREGISLAAQIALSERACLYVGMASGMASSVTFSETPYVIYKHPEYHRELMDRELREFDNLPWANRSQRILRKIPNSINVVAEIERILGE
jgi:hypothetical protein